ncbi:hypothetical protein ACFOQM_13655 [Paenibacillus sp. GCM10012307]|uniref:Uncharacterized protein n=1 Tax=Paenibacillus roseus TaxID=2798579 RepID=A0A934J8Q4_9BACL|nr:hypothetical protein [Paenibacillus roseus]MBJ6362338.1 hypothetical protein [Paenibacillus roseus]
MKKIVNIENVKILESNFLKVFKNKDPFDDDVYADNIQAKLLLFPTEGYYLQKEQFKALIQSITHIGEEQFYISEIEGDCFSTLLSNDSYESGHWVGKNSSSYEEYTNLPIVLESAIYSTNGSWGILISHEGHAILGGSKEFVEKIQIVYSYDESCKQRFIEQWERNQKEYNSNIDWIYAFLKQFS